MEVDETVLLLLRNAKNASIEGQGEARLTIQDDDLDLPFVFLSMKKVKSLRMKPMSAQ